MKNREWYQFQGFLSTPPLWQDIGFFKLKQFSIPKVFFSESPDFSNELPSLKTNYVLGKRIEDFYSLVLKRSSRYNILAQGLQIFQDKITLGEMDFILRDADNEKIIHLEVVYKFYIYDPGIQGELEGWIGPNRKDTLLRKLDKLEQKQLPLLAREETKSALAVIGIQLKNVEQEVSFLAHLFIPRDLRQEVFPYINNDGIAGTWIQMKDFKGKDFKLNEFFIPLKKDWPIDPVNNKNWFSFEEIFPLVDETIVQKRSPLLWMRNTTGNFERFFIVWW